MPASDSATPPRPAATSMAEAAPEERLSDAAQHGLDVVLGLINRLRVLDSSRVFWEPVVGIPGYAEKIKHPMSFRVMENKLRAREYRTWRSFLSDFELICSNAKTFNAPNSAVWKLAGQLQRAGRKLLQVEELNGRRALYDLHPQGPRVAAAEEEAQILKDAGETARSSGLLLGVTTSFDGAAARSDDRSMDVDAEAGVVDGCAAPGTEPDEQLPVPPDEDTAAAARLWDPDAGRLPVSNDWGLLFREAPEPSIDNVLQQSRLSALFLPYSPAATGQAGASGVACGTSEAGQQQQQAAAAVQEACEQQQQQQPGGPGASGSGRQALPRLAPSGRTAEWKAVRRPVEWRAQWLELRLLELGNLIAQIRAAPCPATRSGSAAAAAAAAASAALASSSGAGGGGGSGADVQQQMVLAQRGGVLLPQHVAAVSEQALLSSPFFALNASPPTITEALALRPPSRKPKEGAAVGAVGDHDQQGAGQHKQQQQQEQERKGLKRARDGESEDAPSRTGLDANMQQQQLQHQPEPQADGGGQEKQADAPSTAAADAAVAGACEQPSTSQRAPFDPSAFQSEPGAVFGSLEVVEKQLASVRLQLASAFGIEVSAAPNGVRLGSYAMAKLAGRRGVDCGAFGGSAGGGGGSRMAREGSMTLKRRRVGSSVIDDEVLLSPTAAPRILERPLVNIHIPPVRELPPEQLKARLVAMTTWNTTYSQHGDAALAKPPADVATVLDSLQESSGDEDSGDDHYRRLHSVMEEEEARRLSGFAGTGAQRGRNQNKQQQAAGKDGAGGVLGPPEKRGAPEKRASRSAGPPVKPSPFKPGASSLRVQVPPPGLDQQQQQQQDQQAMLPPQQQQQQSVQAQGTSGGAGAAAGASPDGAGPLGSLDGADTGAAACATPTMVKRATASGPAASGLKRTGSGSLTTRSQEQQQQQQQQAEPRSTRQQAQQQAQKPTSTRPTRMR